MFTIEEKIIYKRFNTYKQYVFNEQRQVIVFDKEIPFLFKDGQILLSIDDLCDIFEINPCDINLNELPTEENNANFITTDGTLRLILHLSKTKDHFSRFNNQSYASQF
jgi:hypothetical protein